MGIQTEIWTGTGTKQEPKRKSNRSGQEPSRKLNPKGKQNPGSALKTEKSRRKKKAKSDGMV